MIKMTRIIKIIKITGKTWTMVGSSDVTAGQVGLIPTAIAWLFRGINEQKNKTGARFSVRVSAVEIAGANEVLRDLLAPHATGIQLIHFFILVFFFLVSIQNSVE